MKKKEYTFADEAKRVQRLFPRRESDPIEKRDYKEAMQRLMQEQEQVRTEQGMNNTNEYATGGPYSSVSDSLYNAYGFQPVYNPTTGMIADAIIQMQNRNKPNLNTVNSIGEVTVTGQKPTPIGVPPTTDTLTDRGMLYGNVSRPFTKSEVPFYLDPSSPKYNYTIPRYTPKQYPNSTMPDFSYSPVTPYAEQASRD